MRTHSKTKSPNGSTSADAGKSVRRRDFLKVAPLALVAVTTIAAPPERDGAAAGVQRHRPAEAPGGAACRSYECEPLSLITWDGAPVADGDFVVIETKDEACAGFVYPAPGGFVKLDTTEEGENVRRAFSPSEVLKVSRVMHVECGGRILAWFPLNECKRRLHALVNELPAEKGGE